MERLRLIWGLNFYNLTKNALGNVISDVSRGYRAFQVPQGHKPFTQPGLIRPWLASQYQFRLDHSLDIIILKKTPKKTNT